MFLKSFVGWNKFILNCVLSSVIIIIILTSNRLQKVGLYYDNRWTTSDHRVGNILETHFQSVISFSLTPLTLVFVFHKYVFAPFWAFIFCSDYLLFVLLVLLLENSCNAEIHYVRFYIYTHLWQLSSAKNLCLNRPVLTSHCCDVTLVTHTYGTSFKW